MNETEHILLLNSQQYLKARIEELASKVEQQADVITQQSVSIASLENRIQHLEIKVGFLIELRLTNACLISMINFSLNILNKIQEFGAERYVRGSFQFGEEDGRSGGNY